MFDFEGKIIALMISHFDSENPDLVVHKGECSEYFDNLKSIAVASILRHLAVIEILQPFI